MDKVKFDYYYRKQAKTRLESVENVIGMIREGRYEKVVNDLKSMVNYAVGNNIDKSIHSEQEVPRVFWSQGANGYTGIITVTLPFGENLSTLAKLRETVNMLQQVMCSFVGSSGRTLKVLMPYTILGKGTDGAKSLETDKEIETFHVSAYQNAAAFLLQITGVKAIGKDEDKDLGTLISYDSEVYYNPDATPVPIPLTDKVPKIVDLNSGMRYSKSLLPDYNTLQMEIVQFNIICRNLGITDSKIDEQILNLAGSCRKAGITEEVAVKCCLALSDKWRDHEILVRTSFENAYRDKALGHLASMPRVLFNQQLLRDFLNKRYIFRRNIITGSNEYMERDRYITEWKPLTTLAMNTILMSAQEAGIEAWDKDLKRYTDSELVNDYDPIAEWLYALPRWDGIDRVAELASTVPTDSPNWNEHFKVWMRSMVSQWMNRNGQYGSSLVLMLVGGQGTRKSTFCKRLMPERFANYYNDRIDFTNKKEAERALMRFVLICMDEFDQITPSQTAYLKHILQKSDVKFRKMYQDDIEQHRRYAAFCATTNSLTPLTDPTGSRRYLCVNVTDNINVTQSIDYEQLYAQVMYEVRHGEKCYLSGEEEADMQEYNKAYYQEKPLETLVDNFFTIPTEGQESKCYTALEALNIIKETAKDIETNYKTVQQLGKILTQKGYERHRMTRGWVYRLARIG